MRRQLLAQRVAVRGPVDGPVEGPAAAVDHLGQRPHRGEIRPPVRGQETEHELLGAFRAQRRGLLAQGRHVTGGEAVGGPQHHPQRNVDGRPDGREGAPGRRQPVGRHVGDQFEAVGSTGLGGDRVLRAERDHLQECALAHVTPILRRRRDRP